MPNTQFLEIPYPDDSKDPYFPDFEDFAARVDAVIYGLMAGAANMIIPADGIGYNSGSGLMTWTGDFLVQILNTGYFLRVQFGPDLATRQILLDEGDRIIIEVPSSSNGEVFGSLRKINGAHPKLTNVFTLGIRKNNKLYLNVPTVLS